MKIGVLALQGDFAAHGRMLSQLGCPWTEIRRADQLGEVDGLILPGGESSTMLKFLCEENLLEPLQEFGKSGKPMFGTCAGAILLAQDVTGPAQASLGVLDIAVQRNGYGRQLDSLVTETDCPALGPEPLELVFIRAPIINRVGPGVDILLEHRDHPVWVRQGNIMAATFHPEMTEDTRMHRKFVEMVETSQD
ncbi:MAG: pyridoxal 5'-phosphate synthase glutaminase subunit PdxT [Blastocatellia bacterium]|nr:pyridoxal 5'-phosphate synthase glutaminase subunit PdxT [Blastocatellia bacterium]